MVILGDLTLDPYKKMHNLVLSALTNSGIICSLLKIFEISVFKGLVNAKQCGKKILHNILPGHRKY